MTTTRFGALYALVVGTFILGFWALLFATDGIPELTTAPYEIGYHLLAEFLTVAALRASGIRLRRGWTRTRRLYPVALGLLLYTVINSAGYYAQSGDVAMVGMFTVLTVATVALLGEYVLGPNIEDDERIGLERHFVAALAAPLRRNHSGAASVLYALVTLAFLVGAVGFWQRAGWATVVILGAATLSTVTLVSM